MNKNQFLKFANREIRKVLYENLTFFQGKLYRKTLLVLNSDYNGDIPDRLWFDLNKPWPGDKNLFLKFANCEICEIPYENLNIIS